MTSFKTGPVDPSLPMELDDGTPVPLKFIAYDYVVVALPKGKCALRSGTSRGFLTVTGDISYSLESGVYRSGTAREMFVLRNVLLPSKNILDNLCLPDDDALRGEFPLFDGLMRYFPNALAEVSRVSKVGNDQHNPGEPMHWARNKSTDHGNKIMRHLVDAGKFDGRGVRHTARAAWRILAMLQEELERDEKLPPSPASTNRSF